MKLDVDGINQLTDTLKINNDILRFEEYGFEIMFDKSHLYFVNLLLRVCGGRVWSEVYFPPLPQERNT
jgi:hypothetical protein